MSSRVVAYGFFGRFAGATRGFRYQMPCSAAAPLSDFRLQGLYIWTDSPREDGLLLSLSIQQKDEWKQWLASPVSLGLFRACGHCMDIDVALCSAPRRALSAPGSFTEFVGDTPLSWHAFENDVGAKAMLLGLPAGPVAVRWTGMLRGLLLMGSVS